MQYDIPPDAIPSKVYGTPEWESLRPARASVPLRRVGPDPIEQISGAEALARFRAARERLYGRAKPMARIAPRPVTEGTPKYVAPEPFGPPTHLYLKWLTRNRIYVTEIIKATVLHFETCLPDIIGASRHAVHIFPRHIAIYLARTLTNRSLPEIGDIFGGRDHTTILSAIRRIQGLIDAGDKRVLSDIAAIRGRLESGE